MVVTGKCNPPQSTAPVMLRYTPAPTITKHPKDTTVCLGQTVQFSVEGQGSGLTYQWQKNGNNIDGAQGSNLVIPNVTASNLGSYTAIVKNSCMLSSTSIPAILTARDPVTITLQPKDTTIQTNLTATFTVEATGTNVKYQWMKNNTNRTGDTLSTLTISNLKLSDSGNYKCVVKNVCGSMESSVAKLTVSAPPAGAALALGVSTVDFGCNKVKSISDTVLTNVVFNGGGQPLNVTAVTLTGSDLADFAIVSGGGAFTLAPNEKHTIAIRFTASTKATKTAALEFTSNSSTTAPKLTLTGKGCSGAIVPFTAGAGTSQVGTNKDTTFQICNTGDFDLVVTAVVLGGANAADFSLGTLPPFPKVIKPTECLPVTATFAPKAEGKRTAEITVKTDEGDFTIGLEGTASPSTDVNESDMFANGVTVYPNPSSGSVFFTGEVASPMPIKVRIFDAFGNSTYQTTISVQSAGTFDFSWDAANSGSRVASGNYTALLSFGTQTIRVPFVIVR
ncbi:MAG: immunoglobulin domain-containing protein [Ignavibacteriae bacterium]|nr:immunoglobulin domain-containing protein [Ignavibacteriota bacterium]